MVTTELKKPFRLYIPDTELFKLREEAKELSKIINRNVTVSKLIRVKLKLNGDLEELKWIRKNDRK